MTTHTPTLPATMSAVVRAPDGSRATTERRRVEMPSSGPDEALVAVDAFSVNRGELALLRSRDPGWRPGQDVAGRVVAAGEGFTRRTGIEVGQRVAALVDGGGWAEYAVAPASRTAAVPDGVATEAAAALPMAGTTALNLVRSTGAVLGRRALVTGASGGVGSLAVQLLALSGAHVVALARETHAARLHELGAAEVVHSLSDVATVDVALESVGGQTLADTVATIAPGGTVVVFGSSSGEPTPLDVFAFAGGHEEARLQTYFSYRHEAGAGAGLATLLDLVARGRLQVEVGLRDSWASLDDALDALEQRRVGGGKVVITVV